MLAERDLITSTRFGELDICFDATVLRPRSWTIAQSEWAAEVAADVEPGPLLELCSGVGHIGLVAASMTGRRLVQVDRSERACSLAAANATAAGIEPEIRNADLRAALGRHERYPLIIADPPYIPTLEVERHPEDPVTAIDGGLDGMDLVRTCIDLTAIHLTAAGVTILQLADRNQVAMVGELASDAGLRVAEARQLRHDRALIKLTAAGRDWTSAPVFTVQSPVSGHSIGTRTGEVDAARWNDGSRRLLTRCAQLDIG